MFPPALSRLAYHILCAGLVPVNDQGIQVHLVSIQISLPGGRVGGMVSRNVATNSTP